MGIRMRVEPGEGEWTLTGYRPTESSEWGWLRGIKNHTPDEFLVAGDLVRSGELVWKLINAYSGGIRM